MMANEIKQDTEDMCVTSPLNAESILSSVLNLRLPYSANENTDAQRLGFACFCYAPSVPPCPPLQWGLTTPLLTFFKPILCLWRRVQRDRNRPWGFRLAESPTRVTRWKECLDGWGEACVGGLTKSNQSWKGSCASSVPAAGNRPDGLVKVNWRSREMKVKHEVIVAPSGHRNAMIYKELSLLNLLSYRPNYLASSNGEVPLHLAFNMRLLGLPVWRFTCHYVFHMLYLGSLLIIRAWN